MTGLLDRIYYFCYTALKIISLILAALLFLGSFLSTSYSEDMLSQTVLFRLDNPLWGVLGIAVFIYICFRIMRAKKLHVNRMTAAVLLWCCVLGWILAFWGRTVPAADAMSVYLAAGELADGQTTVICPDNSYFSYYPQQMGLVAFFELLIRFWNFLPVSLHAYHFIKCVYVLFACAIIFFQKEILHLIWKDERIDCIYLLLAGINFPFIMYTSFVYGEIPSYAFVSAGLYFLLRFARADSGSRRFSFGLAAISFLSIGVALRKNNLIFIIAVLIVTFLQFLRKRKPYLMCFLCLCALCSFGIQPCIQKIYELRAGNYLSEGVPPIAYLAMGMQDTPDARCVGWYNGFNVFAYEEAGMDIEAAAAISREAIRERLVYFRDNPAYAVSFYAKKHLSQWADGTYASRQATLATFGGRSTFFQSLYEGAYSRYFIEYANLYQNVLYLGLLLFCIFQCRRTPVPKENAVLEEEKAADLVKEQDRGMEKDLLIWTGMIGIIGGFLFHIIWEANSRYILLYSLTMMPYAAQGIYAMLRMKRGPARNAGK